MSHKRRDEARRRARGRAALLERGLLPDDRLLSEESAAAAFDSAAERKAAPGSRSRWPAPLPDGRVPWSTPRESDVRPRDNVFRAAPSRRRAV